MSTSADIPVPSRKQKIEPTQAFHPFYMRLSDLAPRSAALLCAQGFVLGAAFFGIHYAIVRDSAFYDFSWLLASMISCVFLLLSYATITLRGLFPEMDKRIRTGSPQVYLDPLNRWLSDRNFILAGIAFGALNDWMGYRFGICDDGRNQWTTFGGFFVVGFIAGMAAYSIVGVSDTLRRFITQGKPPLDYRSPDGCGGLAFLGTALMKFGIVTFVMGVLISVYIVFGPWTNGDHRLVQFLMWFWIGFPYAMSLVAFLAPGLAAHGALHTYKAAREEQIQQTIDELEKRIVEQGSSVGKELQEKYEYAVKLRAEIYAMRTWPYEISSIRAYIMTILSGSAQVFTEAQKLLGHKWGA
jgi:hypothetical protein